MARPPHVALAVVLVLALASCNRDHSITKGAGGHGDWDRRLKAAVPLGASIASAQSTLEQNGFTCHRDALAASTVRCDKRSSRRLGFFRRYWHAEVSSLDGKVTKVMGSTMFGRKF